MYRRRMAIGHQDHPRWVSNTAEVAILFTLSVHANYRGAREGLATQIKSLVVYRALGSGAEIRARNLCWERWDARWLEALPRARASSSSAWHTLRRGSGRRIATHSGNRAIDPL
jgi:hypothetical protein